MTTKQTRIGDAPETLDAKPARKILPAHERFARDERKLQDARAKHVQSLLARESGLLDDLRALMDDCEAAKCDDATVIGGRCRMAIEQLEKVQG